jgi:repressor LexA
MSLLTKKQKEVMDFLKNYYDKNGLTPTMKEVAEHFEVSITTIQNHFKSLEYKGYIKKTPNLSRSIEIRDNKKQNMFVSLPLVGMVGAGYGVEMYEENQPEMLDVPANWLNPSQKNSYYCLKVDGFSMAEDGVLDGDIIVVRKQEMADNGEPVIAYIKDTNEVTLKRFYKRQNTFELKPKNTNLQYKSKLVSFDNLEIKGKFIGLLRVA